MSQAKGLHEADFGGPCRVCGRTCFMYYEREYGKGMERVHANCKIRALEAEKVKIVEGGLRLAADWKLKAVQAGVEIANCKSYSRNLAASLVELGKRLEKTWAEVERLKEDRDYWVRHASEDYGCFHAKVRLERLRGVREPPSAYPCGQKKPGQLKRGERGSGTHAKTGPDTDGSVSTVSSDGTVTNPATLHPCPDCDPLHEQYQERIHVMQEKNEAEVERLTETNQANYDSWREAITRAEKAEAELAEAIRQRDGWNRIANQENADKKKLKARVEGVEAEVERLKVENNALKIAILKAGLTPPGWVELVGSGREEAVE